MSRNAESRFAKNPTDLDIRRSRFERPFNHTLTMDIGDLVPFYCSEILPGDSVQLKTSKVVRTSTMKFPVMDNLIFDVYYFFVPMRLTFDKTKEFFGENTSGPWYPQQDVVLPLIKYALDENDDTPVQTVVDYLGIPIEARSHASDDPTEAYDFEFNACPVRAYNITWNEWFRDQMTMAPANVYTGESTVNFDKDDPVKGGKCQKVSKLHDYFSSCTPQPQRGPSVEFSLAEAVTATIPAKSVDVKTASSTHMLGYVVKFGGSSGNSEMRRFTSTLEADPEHGYPEYAQYVATVGDPEAGESIKHSEGITQTNLVVNIPEYTNIPITGLQPISVNELRMAFQLQRYYERAALFGGRYTEFIRAQFGTVSPDARLQRPEYLGGNRITLNVQQVEQTSQTDETPLGHLAAYSVTSDSHGDFMHSFTEHGYLLGLCCCRYKHRFSQGLNRMWSRRTMFDVYMPVMANLGNQAVLRKEIFCTGDPSNDDQVFGYQEAWADYRFSPDRVSGFMRPGISGSLAAWHYADYYETAPTLSESWMYEDKSNVDRTLAVTSDVAPQLIADIHVDQIWTRAMPLYSVPGLIDHH